MNFLPSTSVGAMIHGMAYLPSFGIPPPVTANTPLSKHGRWVEADMVNATRLEPQQLHGVMIMLMVASGNDRAAVHDADSLGGGHT